MDYNIDAKNKILGRVATEVSMILQGKKSPDYLPNRVSKDRVFISNIEQIAVTGDKLTDKVYHRHTGYVGGIKTLTLEQKLAKDPRSVLRQAVRKMLPRNFLNQQRIKNMIFVEKGK